MITKILGAFAIGVILSIATSPVAADTAEDFSIKRSTSMKKMDSAMNEISQRAGGLFAFDKQVIRKKIDILHAEISNMHTLFPEGSSSQATLPEIWSNPELFTEKIYDALARVDGLSGELETANRKRVKKLYKKIHRGCTGCHYEFRK